MKFCGKCRKMKVKNVTNPNNVYRVCRCDLDEIFLNWDSHSRLKTMASSTVTRNKEGIYEKNEEG